MTALAAPHIWTPPKHLGQARLARLMAHLRKGSNGHLLKTSSGHLATSCDNDGDGGPCPDAPSSATAPKYCYKFDHGGENYGDPVFYAICGQDGDITAQRATGGCAYGFSPSMVCDIDDQDCTLAAWITVQPSAYDNDGNVNEWLLDLNGVSWSYGYTRAGSSPIGSYSNQGGTGLTNPPTSITIS